MGSMIVEVKTKREFPVPNRRSRQRENIPVEDMPYEAWFHCSGTLIQAT
ncbi:hypothetical protein ACZ87_03133 [Candidatus Erwinia dacicola]|uniref:Uncharacterized protein n=1 Tax=Candidatus Erwinia dacicola TaxID=252393 RepID=A0A328TLJ0_9GAMM|nr:hypothetical protein ACZ87_03133 [Candidatus Erwinia dacicola]